MRDKHSPLLTVMAGEAALNCHFFIAAEIEFDCDPQEITDAHQAEMIAAFMRLLGQVTVKPVILCHENMQLYVIARYSSADGDVTWRVSGIL